MDKTKIQKVNKALIATVFATSGIAVVVPPPQKVAAATSPFVDINQYSSHYDNILKLYAQGAISGFADKTFRPNQNVTRGQAAKMLATVLKLDLKNVEDPYFKDVPKSNEYYKYVAALQNAGIMSGYANGSFMPNEVITRGQLAKILVLGFKFEVASNFNHSFQDINSQSSNAYYIQTLVDLKITEGTTPVTFSPFNAVTRGQIASFIVRSQEKKGNVSTYKITGVEDDTVYINSEPYSVPENLSHIFNEYNADVLKGAFIEGDISGKSIYSVAKLTLNASGTSSRKLQFDGDYKSFGGTIVVNGNYIDFNNVTLTGTMLVNETVRPPLHLDVSYYKPLAIGRVASNNFSFINWSNPEKPEDESSNSNPSGDLQNWTDSNKNPDKNKPFENWSKDKVTMKNVEKHIEFYNSTVSRLVVSQSGTKIETNTKLPRVDIIGNVREFEIQGNIGTLNLDTETALTIYGDSNIDWINYNSYTDLKLYIDGRVGTLYVDNAYGWLDIGDYTYIDKVILPKGEGPNNIFDDFLNDKDNVGNITDPDGKPIDKDDIDNQKPADKTKPLIDITKLTVLNGSDVQVEFTSDKVGTYYYIVREKGVEVPTKREMVNRIEVDKNVATGTASAVNGKNTIKINSLGEKKEYVVYVMVVDGAKNASDIKSQSFQMKDSSPPSVKSLMVTPLHGGTRAEFTFTASEPGEYFYYVRKKTTAADPTTADVMANPTGTGKALAGKLGISGLLTGLDPEQEYQLYVVMKDDSGNNSIDPIPKEAIKEFKTGALDNLPPYIVGGELFLQDEIKNEFYVTVSEELDSIEAEKVENYELTGTGIVNQGLQKPIRPEKVVYNKAQKRLTFIIPSLTGFVNGDNLVVTISPNVKDLAGNEFENINNTPVNTVPRNTAEYIHKDGEWPYLTIIGEPAINAAKDQTLVEFNATKAGTYHYLIMESDLNLTRDDRLGLIEAVQLNATKFKVGGKDIPIIGSGGNKPAQLGKQKVTVPLPNTIPPLDPFKSYSIYMVLRDRSGNVSDIQTKHVIDDRTAPVIDNTSIKILEGDRKATFRFMSDENGSYYYVLRKVGDPTPGPTTPEEVMAKGITSSMRKGTNEISLTLEPHQEYELYVAVKDRYNNVTMVQKGKESKVYTFDEKQNKTITLTDRGNGNGNGEMKYTFFSDGTPPKVEDPIYKRIDGKTFEVTFSEAVDTGFDFKLVQPGTTTPITPTYKHSWKDVTGTNDWESRKLIITFNTEVKESFDISVNAAAKDKGGWTFSKDRAEYKYPTKENTITSATLLADTEFPDNKEISKKVQVVANLNADITWDQQYYYAVLNKDNALTPDNVLDVITKADSNNFTSIPGGAIISYGKGKITAPSDASMAETFTAIQTGGSSSKTNIFQTGQRIYLFTKDKYGNIVYAKSKDSSALDYVLIQPRTQ
ncbi:S-layer homology domain-containing protein [Lysinibacillus mangiferihumi]|uniref:S-layer homology domain-containing protein n=1 Tax=Lysinibacillus mangiferihumi TaxID=1130819 RepID=A0A4U2ZC32_9BACI|nr:S-layer homology domain-containing protein [Lysinibacillus mangiferihumi]TKI71814.1 S-layer homology domain-containing protein [Lysinibacillus mangiferihumi]